MYMSYTKKYITFSNVLYISNLVMYSIFRRHWNSVSLVSNPVISINEIDRVSLVWFFFEIIVNNKNSSGIIQALVKNWSNFLCVYTNYAVI